MRNSRVAVTSIEQQIEDGVEVTLTAEVQPRFDHSVWILDIGKRQIYLVLM